MLVLPHLLHNLREYVLIVVFVLNRENYFFVSIQKNEYYLYLLQDEYP
jgi:hypothetical protein